jgi:hypothetical protein
VLAGDTLFIAGPPDVVEQEETLWRLDAPETARRLAEQRDAYAGRTGGVLLAVTTSDGAKRAAYRLDSMPVFDGLIAANERLFLSNVDGSVLCLAGTGTPLRRAPGVELAETPFASVPGKHPEFEHVAVAAVTRCDLGWRLRAPGGKVGFALRKLGKAITERTTFNLQVLMIPNPRVDNSRPPPGNAFLAFGSGTDDEDLVKCGLRSAGQVCQIVEGPLLTGRIRNHGVQAPVRERIDMSVTVDPAAGTVTVEVLGETLDAKLKRPPGAISYLGYAVHSVAAEFGRIETVGP